MALSEIDRNLLQSCLQRKPRAWEDFVDRFLGLVVHVINHSSQSRSMRLSQQDSEDLAAEVFMALVENDFSILRRFRGECSLATYLTVVARRVAVRELLKRKTTASLNEAAANAVSDNGSGRPEERINNIEHVNLLLDGLSEIEADVVRKYHLEGKSYHEISSETGVPENSIGPTLSRARAKMRQAGVE